MCILLLFFCFFFFVYQNKSKKLWKIQYLEIEGFICKNYLGRPTNIKQKVWVLFIDFTLPANYLEKGLI